MSKEYREARQLDKGRRVDIWSQDLNLGGMNGRIHSLNIMICLFKAWSMLELVRNAEALVGLI